MESQRDGSVRIDPREDLEAVVSWLEQGHWEEVDQPHNSEGSTPLISACQRGQSMVRTAEGEAGKMGLSGNQSKAQ